MHADENARDVARRLVQEAVSRADGTRPVQADAPPTDAQRIAHRVVLEALADEAATGETATERAARRRDSGVLARPTVSGPPSPPEVGTSPEPEPRPEPDPPRAAEPAAEPMPVVGSPQPVVSPASAEAARRIVAATVAERDSPDRPGPPPLPASIRAATAEIVEDPARPAATVNLLPDVDPPGADPTVAPTETAAPAAYLPAAGPPPVFPLLGEPGTGGSLLDQPVVEPNRQVPAPQRLTPLDRWRARRHRKRLAAQWAPGATPQPRRTWRWVLATVIVALALGVLFPLTVAAFRALVAL